MRQCSVKWCGKTNPIRDGITFHKFPTHPNIKQKWIEATNRDNWIPKKHNAICSRHFTEDCFRIIGERRFLFKTAVPTEMLPRVSYHQNVSSVSSTADSETLNTLQPTSHLCGRLLFNVPPNIMTPRERHLYRIANELSVKFKKCKATINRLRSTNSSLKRRVKALERRVGRLQEDLSVAQANAFV